MKALFVARRFPPDVHSGAETVFAALHAEARADGVEAPLIAGFTRSPAGFPDGTRAVDLRGGLPGSRWLRMARAATDAATALRPDVVLSNSVECVPGSAPVALIVHDLNFGSAGEVALRSGRLAFYRVQCGRAAAVVVPSEATRARLAEIGVRDRVHVIRNGVDLERFRPQPPRGDGRLRFVVHGRILPGKGAHAALDALGRMRPDQRNGLELVIAGACVDRVYLDRLRVQAYNLPVRFVTDVADLAPEVRAADIVLFPTLMEEGFGLAALEGMACGRPVIHYDQPAVREATGGHAIAVPRDDASALRDAMLGLVRDADARARLGREGRAWAERHAWKDVWARYAALLGAVARRDTP